MAPRRSTARLTGLVLLTSAGLTLAPAPISRATPPASEPWLLTRTLQAHQVRIPCVFAPAHLGHPLRLVEDLLATDDVTGVRLALERTLRGLDGRLLPPLDEPELWRPWARVPAPSEVLRSWQRALPTGKRVEIALANVGPPTSTSSETDPVLWHAAAQPAARAQFDRAIEAAQWGRALRLLEAIPRDAVSPALETQVLTHARAATRVDRLAQLATDRADAQLPKVLNLQLSVPLDPERELRPTSDHPEGVRGRIGYRPAPAATVLPLVGGGELIFVVGPRALAIATDAPARILWDRARLQEGASAPGLTHAPASPVPIPGGFMAPERGVAPENPLLIPPSHRGLGQWTSWRAYRYEPGRPATPTRDASARFLDDVRTAGSICAPPWVDGEIVAVLTARGWDQLEIKLHAGSARSGSLLWTRSLGVVERPWLAANDLRSLVPVGHLERIGDDLVATPGVGWIARVDARTGEYRGVLLYERLDPESEPSQPVHTIDRTRFRELPAPSSRPGGQRQWVSSVAERPLYVVLPADGSHVLAIDLVRWQVSWAHGPVGPETQLLAERDGRCVLVDPRVAIGESHLGARWIDGATGRLDAELRLDLESPHRPTSESAAVRAADPKSGADLAANAPILSGLPTATAHQLWVPCRQQLLAWNWEHLEAHGDGGSVRPDHAVDWPPGSVGGTAMPLTGGGIVCFSRGFAREGTSPVIEVFGGAAPR
ncbi:MAG: hypothetical protein AB7O52_01735 [Planctomycetota bacterium]